ncbi:hypothetical protein H6P81_002857 [Aristolochia fimbriata]|uniref:RNase H type-1 domain-containing protein n=1 Tax=Aristolochia fimbriata TaxID=158543 RepID=A0AAV7FCQ3_ARIFI|nr:hypothetical protein H6P81_002857 [Aristolochia fimbriata]
MKNVGLSAGDLSPISLLIQGFNQEGQRTLGMICLKLLIGDMVAETPFQVMDSRTSYNLLLGRPWLHVNGVVPSTLHQCFKYWENGEQKMVYADEIVDDNQEDDEFILKEAPATFEEGGLSTVDGLKKVDLGTKEDPRPTFLSALLSADEEVEYMSLLCGYRDILAWNYTEMPGLDPRVAVHKLVVHPSVQPIKQSQRRFRPELMPEIEKEVDKLIAANFIREVKYPSWIANIVPVKKKNGQIQVYVDFYDLKKACPKDDFPLPITELMVDTMMGHETLSFMDGSSGYNQIQMDPKDEELTAFHTPKGIFCYKGSIRAASTISAQNEPAEMVILCNLRQISGIRCAPPTNGNRPIQNRCNSKEAGAQKHHRTQELSRPLSVYSRFISNLARRCQPFSCLLKKDTPFEWDKSCQNAFNNIKAYLTKPPVLVAPIVDRLLLLYIAVQQKSIGALLAQYDKDNKDRSLYYLSRMLEGTELNYTQIEKTCLALVFAIQKLWHYLFPHSMNLISRADPLKYIMSRPILSGRLAKWALLLSKFEINFVPQHTIKGQALANFLADHPVRAERELTEELPDEEILLVEVLPPWEMYFDDAARRNGAGMGVQFVSLRKDLVPYCSNNEAEYQAILLGFGMAVEMKLPQLNIYGDSALVIKQLTGEFKVKKLELMPFWKHVGELLAKIPKASLHYVPRYENGLADALAGIAASLVQFDDWPSQVPICERR